MTLEQWNAAVDMQQVVSHNTQLSSSLPHK
jgi:hypothetical protein